MLSMSSTSRSLLIQALLSLPFALTLPPGPMLPLHDATANPLVLSRNVSTFVDPDFDYVFKPGTELLPELSCYFVTIQIMVDQALRDYKAMTSLGNWNNNGLDIWWGGCPMNQPIPRSLLLQGLHTSVWEMGISHRFLTGTYYLLYLGQPAGFLLYTDASSRWLTTNDSLPMHPRDSSSASNTTTGSDLKRPVNFHYSFLKKPLQRREYFTIIARTLLKIAPRLKHWPVQDCVTRALGDTVESKIIQLSHRRAPSAFAMWEDAVRMLLFAAQVAEETKLFREIEVTAGYKVGSLEAPIGRLEIRKAEGTEENRAASTGSVRDGPVKSATV